MASQARDRLEADIRRLCLRGELDAATTQALRGYGPEIYGFLLGFHRSEGDAAEVFSAFSVRVWRGLSGFDWSSSFRTWAYTIARNCSLRHAASEAKRARRHPPLPEGHFLSSLAEEVRSATRSFLKTDFREQVARLRGSLSTEEQVLLALRVDRKLSWLDLARVLGGAVEPVSMEELQRESAKLRKRFQTIKERLRALSRAGREAPTGEA